jgi:hypothetical protein
MTTDQAETLAPFAWLGIAALAGVLAQRKGRSVPWALVAGMVFGIAAVIALAIMPPRGADGPELAPREHRGIRGAMRRHRELRAAAGRGRQRSG